MATPASPAAPSESNLSKFASGLDAILQDADHREMYGVELQPPTADDKQSPLSTLNILQKFLRANLNDLPQAKSQLAAALKWRKTYNPKAALDEVFPSSKFGGLGYVTTITGAKETKNPSDTAVFNIYGVAAKDPKKTFGDTDAFVRWRVALMELTLARLKLGEADTAIPEYGQGVDPYQAIQVHDYLSVSFFRQPGEIKASSTKIIDLFQRYYPETVSYKYFVNVPLVMQWMMGAMKALMSKDSIQKMTWLTYGNTLHTYLGEDIPTEYGGKGVPLKEKALTVKYDEPSPTHGANGSASEAKVEPTKTTTAIPPWENAEPVAVEEKASQAAS